jgi:hypothetical protein
MLRLFVFAAVLAVAAPAFPQTAPKVRDPKVADFLQQVAADTVKEYFGKDL